MRRTYRRDIEAAYASLEGAETQTVETEHGTVEYATEGEGVPVLVAHGIVGGFDQALATGRNLAGDAATIIGVSRFGYLGSELPARPTPEAQAAAYVHVLDDLGIDTCVVVGTSAGGAPALRFALDHPERTRGLVLVGAATPSTKPIPGATGPPTAMLRDPLFWLLVTHAPWALRSLFGIDSERYDEASTTERAAVDALLETLLPVEPRVPGIENDAAVTNTDVVDAYEKYEVESLSVPTLVIHAEDDPLASVEDATQLAERVPEAELVAFDSGGHLVFGHGDEVETAVSEFLERVFASASVAR